MTLKVSFIAYSLVFIYFQVSEPPSSEEPRLKNTALSIVIWHFSIFYLFLPIYNFRLFHFLSNSTISHVLQWKSRIGSFTLRTKCNLLFGNFTRFVNSRISHQYQFAFLPPTHILHNLLNTHENYVEMSKNYNPILNNT